MIKTLCLICGLVIVFDSVCAQETPSQPLPTLAQPFTAPLFELPSDDGSLHQLKDYRGKVVILNFWATWCPPCRYEMPSMERAWQKIKNKNVIMLGINVGEDADTIFEFTGQYPVSFPLLMDQDSRIIKQYSVTGLPTTYIINPDGQVVYRAMGSREWDNDDIIQQLLGLLKH